MSKLLNGPRILYFRFALQDPALWPEDRGLIWRLDVTAASQETNPIGHLRAQWLHFHVCPHQPPQWRLLYLWAPIRSGKIWFSVSVLSFHFLTLSGSSRLAVYVLNVAEARVRFPVKYSKHQKLYAIIYQHSRLEREKLNQDNKVPPPLLSP